MFYLLLLDCDTLILQLGHQIILTLVVLDLLALRLGDDPALLISHVITNILAHTLIPADNILVTHWRWLVNQ